MQHLDEGTIHAWLDGELSADDAERAAHHAAECAECGARVADARGVLAGASRIVSALDAGPVGVIPPAQRTVQTKRRSWYRFALTPARMSIAATLVLAAGVTLTVQRSRLDREDMPPSTMIDSSAPPSLPVVTDSLAPAAPAPREATRPQSAGAAAQKQESRVVAPTPEAAATGLIGGTPIDNKKTVLESKPRDANAVERAPAAVMADAASRVPAPAAAPAAAPAPAVPSGAARLDSARAKGGAASAKDGAASAALAGDRAVRPALERQQSVSPNQLKQSVATSEREPPSTNATPSQDCYRLDIDSTAWRGALPSMFALAPALPGSAVGASTDMTARKVSAAQFVGRALIAGTGNAVHGVTAAGRVDSLMVGDWSQSAPSVVRVRFAAVAQRKPVTLILAANSSTAQLISLDRTDSVHVFHMTCAR